MLAKKYRLAESELRKVLQKKKPFFSYMFIANVLPHQKGFGRTAILLSSKVARGSVNRNFWRRKLYDMIGSSLTLCSLDIVFVPKKGTILDAKNPAHIVEFEKNILFLIKKIKETPVSASQTGYASKK